MDAHRSVNKVLVLFFVCCLIVLSNFEIMVETARQHTLKKSMLLAFILVIVGHQIAMQSSVLRDLQIPLLIKQFQLSK